MGTKGIEMWFIPSVQRTEQFGKWSVVRVACGERINPHKNILQEELVIPLYR